MIIGLGVMTGSAVEASVNLPLHHWAYEAIERLTALGVIDRAMVVPKPYSRKQAAKYVARAIERIRADQVPLDGREVLAEPLLDRLMQEFRSELMDLGVIAGTTGKSRGAVRYGGRAQDTYGEHPSLRRPSILARRHAGGGDPRPAGRRAGNSVTKRQAPSFSHCGPLDPAGRRR